MQVRVCPNIASTIFNAKNNIPFLAPVIRGQSSDNTGYPYNQGRVNTFVYDREKVGELESLRGNFVSVVPSLSSLCSMLLTFRGWKGISQLIA